MSNVQENDLILAIDRIAHSPDGHLLYRYLQKVLCATTSAQQPDCALRQHEGRRMFASELMGMMSKGIADSDRYAIAIVRSSTERSPATRGAARRINADTIVPGWDSPALGGGTVGNAPSSTPSTPSGPDAA